MFCKCMVSHRVITKLSALVQEGAGCKIKSEREAGSGEEDLCGDFLNCHLQASSQQHFLKQTFQFKISFFSENSKWKKKKKRMRAEK